MDMSEASTLSAQRENAAPNGHVDGTDEANLLRRLIVEKLTYATGRDPLLASDRDWFVATALALRDRIVATVQQTCGSWPAQYDESPVPPPLQSQLPCEKSNIEADRRYATGNDLRPLG